MAMSRTSTSASRRSFPKISAPICHAWRVAQTNRARLADETGGHRPGDERGQIGPQGEQAAFRVGEAEGRIQPVGPHSAGEHVVVIVNGKKNLAVRPAREHIQHPALDFPAQTDFLAEKVRHAGRNAGQRSGFLGNAHENKDERRLKNDVRPEYGTRTGEFLGSADKFQVKPAAFSARRNGAGICRVLFRAALG
jgi:hypothetical protein